MEDAGTGRRFAALTLDWLLCWLVAGLLAAGSLNKGQFTHLGLFFIEVAVLTSLQQASAGQRILHLRVVDFQTGGMIPPRRIFIRTLLICLVLPAIFKRDGRNLHDVFSNSRVIKI
jgi:uncharacterized RDD family membrane protein YckC